jgi:hypothetical protein
MRRMVKLFLMSAVLFSFTALCAQVPFRQTSAVDSIPHDLPLPTITVLKNTADGYIFAAVPYWGQGASYLAAYNNEGRPVLYKKVSSACTDFKMQENGQLTYFDFDAKKFFALDSTLSVIDEFSAQHGFLTDEHDLKILGNGSALIIGYEYKLFDLSGVVAGGSTHANVIVNVVQELDKYKRVVFEWRADEHYKFTDVGPEVNLLDESFQFTHINSVDVDRDGNLIISSRHLDEITKINRNTGAIMWRLGGKNNEFAFINDSIRFSGQHSVRVLPNGNLLLFDNGVSHVPAFSRAVEYTLDTVRKTAELVWSYRNTPDIASDFWGNAQRLGNGNTFISWGHADVAATEVDSSGNKVFEMMFPKNVFSYRILRFPLTHRQTGTPVSVPPCATSVTLDQNFPNLFNPSTLLQFTLPSVCRVQLRIEDVLGRVAAVVADGVMQPGVHRIIWHASVPSGVYFYRLDAVTLNTPQKRFTQVRRMLLVR